MSNKQMTALAAVLILFFATWIEIANINDRLDEFVKQSTYENHVHNNLTTQRSKNQCLFR